MKIPAGIGKRYPLWTSTWSRDVATVRMKAPVLIVGLPGIGNVGKIVVDLLIENLGAQKLVSFFSEELPHSVFVQESGLVALPGLALYRAKASGRDFLFLAGDVQPMTERSSYQLASLVLDIAASVKAKEIVTLGGIGLPELPQNPRLYVTGHDAKAVEAFSKGLPMHRNLYGVVGPIIGISGILVGLAGRRRMPAYCVLAETLGNQLHLGLVGARRIIAALAKRYGFAIGLSRLDKEIRKFQIQLRNESQLGETQAGGKRQGERVDYIG